MKQETILLLGSGALKIGEAGEFDYSGSQAIKALKEEGKRVVLVNPNIATIQTSQGLADRVYFLPVSALFVKSVIIKEKPTGILLSFGGQTALTCGMELFKSGVLVRYGVAILGTPMDAILATEDRVVFAERLGALGLPTAQGKTVLTTQEGLSYAQALGYPVMVRAGFALGGTGSGIAKDETALMSLLSRALGTTSQVIIEESLLGWKEVEYEVLRDGEDNCITVCNMENVDPVGIHTGESIVVAPSQTLSNREYYMLRQASIDTIRALKIVGECNIQFALHPTTGAFRIIEVNARLSRSSALASKATGYPLAYVAAKLALGKTLPDLRNKVTDCTSAFFEPALDYIVVKIPRWDLEKFTNVVKSIGSEMKSVGEVMSIGRTFEEAIQKAARMLNDGYSGVIDAKFNHTTRAQLLKRLKIPDTMRLFTICAALRAGISVMYIHTCTGIDLWFLEKLSHIVHVYKELSHRVLTKPLLRKAKRTGFSDHQIADLTGNTSEKVRTKRIQLGVVPYIKRIDTMAGEFPAKTNYFYMTYNADSSDHAPNKKEKKVMILGCGPYAVGTSVEFDWCAVTTSLSLRERGVKSIMVNCNPETVSTDYDMSDYLYFEELTLERVLDIVDAELHVPVIVSVGGQIPNNLAPKLARCGIRILGTDPSDIYRAEHRKTFSKLLDDLGIAQPRWAQARSASQAQQLAHRFTYPVLVRPSFVLSGKAMSVLYTPAQLSHYMQHISMDLEAHPLVMSKFLSDAVECDLDGVARNGVLIVHALCEHVEGGGVHSGDSTLLFPALTLSSSVRQTILSYTKKIIKALCVHGPVNIQFLVAADCVYVIECNLRASRSFPFVSKALGLNFIETATAVMLGEPLSIITTKTPSYQVVKAPQFSFHKLREADPTLKVEMSSTGEVAAFGFDAQDAYCKAILATGVPYPVHKAVFVSLGGRKGKLQFIGSCKRLHNVGYTFFTTSGTGIFLRENGIPTTVVHKMDEHTGRTVAGLLQEKSIDFAVVIPDIDKGEVGITGRYLTDGYTMRRLAVDAGIPIFTNTQTADFFVKAITAYTPESVSVLAWDEYLKQ